MAPIPGYELRDTVEYSEFKNTVQSANYYPMPVELNGRCWTITGPRVVAIAKPVLVEADLDGMKRVETVGSEVKVGSIMVLRGKEDSSTRKLWHVVRVNVPIRGSKVHIAYLMPLTATINCISGSDGGISEYQVVGCSATVAAPANSLRISSSGAHPNQLRKRTASSMNSSRPSDKFPKRYSFPARGSVSQSRSPPAEPGVQGPEESQLPSQSPEPSDPAMKTVPGEDKNRKLPSHSGGATSSHPSPGLALRMGYFWSRGKAWRPGRSPTACTACSCSCVPGIREYILTRRAGMRRAQR